MKLVIAIAFLFTPFTFAKTVQILDSNKAKFIFDNMSEPLQAGLSTGLKSIHFKENKYDKFNVKCQVIEEISLAASPVNDNDPLSYNCSITGLSENDISVFFMFSTAKNMYNNMKDYQEITENDPVATVRKNADFSCRTASQVRVNDDFIGSGIPFYSCLMELKDENATPLVNLKNACSPDQISESLANSPTVQAVLESLKASEDLASCGLQEKFTKPMLMTDIIEPTVGYVATYHCSYKDHKLYQRTVTVKSLCDGTKDIQDNVTPLSIEFDFFD